MTTDLSSRSADRCRACGSKDLYRYLDLGRSPLANSYLAEKDLGGPEFREELCLQLCRDCGLSFLTKVVHPDRMFKHYLYVSSTTETMRSHFGEFAKTCAEYAGAGKEDLALDIASNDGCLLRGFQAVGMKVIGVDPAENLAKEANANGVPTECAYWGKAVAESLARRLGKAKCVTAANVFAHVDDWDGFVDGVSAILAPGGVLAIEAPYALDFIERTEFDTAYHEHLSYVSITPVTRLMARHGFEVVDVSYFPKIHGGTARIFCARKGERKAGESVAEYLERERKFGLSEKKPYDAFAGRVKANREALRELLGEFRAKGAVVWAYGASAKGATLMSAYGLTRKEVPVVIDDNPKKWDLYTPGSHMRITGISALKENRVDYLLLLSWNFKDEILKRCRAAGYAGRAIVPVPAPAVLDVQGAKVEA